MTERSSFARESTARLVRAEQQGLRLAISIRTVVIGLAFVWYVGAPLTLTGEQPRVLAALVLIAFILAGIAHLMMIGTAWDRWWIKYGVYGLDALAICATFALIPISRSDEIPQIIAFRAYGIYYLFPLLAMACLSLSWRLVLWTGAMTVVGWWAAYLWVIVPMDQTLSWADIPAAATRSDYETTFLSINFIGRGNRIEESVMVLCTAAGLALAVFRARAVFFAQVAADLDHQREKSARERVSSLLAKYLPEEIAEKLIADEAPLRPLRAEGTALVMDIAGFTAYSSKRSPEQVIADLDAFLADATNATTAEGGVVISYLGDGFLVTFNAPVAVAHPADAALRAAARLFAVANKHKFDIRIGVASGPLVTGTIGSDQRQSFTVYGAPVNLASRLEAACKQMAMPGLCDEATAMASATPRKYKSVGQVNIAGLAKPVHAFGLRVQETQVK